MAIKPLAGLLALLALGGCASFSSDGGYQEVSRMTQERTGQAVKLGRLSEAEQEQEQGAAAASQQAQALLAQPLAVDGAVQLALLNNQGLKADLAQLGVSEAELVQAGRMSNPGISFSKMRGGGESEIERGIVFDVVGLLTMPVRTRIETRRFEQARLAAAAQAVQLAADTRRAWFTAVAAGQTVTYMEQVAEAAEASAELAQRMKRAGSWSKLDEAREQVFYAEAMAELAKSRLLANSGREQLIRLLGLWGPQADQLKLPQRLPDLPAQVAVINDIESQAMQQRLDLLASRRSTESTAFSLGLTKATRFVNVLEAGYANKSTSGAPRENGYEISLELPLFDWGGARTRGAEALYMQALHRTADTAVRARSEVREAYVGYRGAYDLARHYRDQVLPLRKTISDEVLLRYNGMLSSVFELLADAREQITSVNTSIEAQRDFWIAESSMRSAIHGGLAPSSN